MNSFYLEFSSSFFRFDFSFLDFFSCFESFYFFVFCVLLLFYGRKGGGVFLSCISLTSFFFDFDVGECV